MLTHIICMLLILYSEILTVAEFSVFGGPNKQLLHDFFMWKMFKPNNQEQLNCFDN